LIPDSLDVEITHFVRSEDSILISGSTDTFNAVDEIKGRLEKAKPFGKITISSANQDKTTNRIQFKLKVEL
jgi:general secretion pathway protein L